MSDRAWIVLGLLAVLVLTSKVRVSSAVLIPITGSESFEATLPELLSGPQSPIVQSLRSLGTVEIVTLAGTVRVV